MKKTHLSLAALLLVVLLSFTGCGKDPKNDTKNTENKEKILVYGSSDYTSINPALYEHGEINSLIFGGLTAHNEKNQVVAGLAKEWDFDETSNIYTFTLKDNLKFQDGEPCTAEDVEFTLRTIMNPDNHSEIASNYEDITNIEVKDEKTIAITLKAPNVAMLDYLTIGILPKHLLEGKDIITDEFNQNPIGTGPYKLTGWDKGQSIILEKNEFYHGNSPKIDKVIFKIVEDTNAKALQLKSGEIDLAQVTPKDAKQFENDEKFMVDIMKTADYRGILFNFNNDYIKSNKGLVNALSYGIDRKAIIDSVLLGHGQEAYSPLQMGPYNNPDVEKFTYDPIKAEEELEKLGWSKGPDGIYEKDGKPLAFTIHCMEGDQVRIDMGTICAQQLKELGLDVKVAVEAETDWANQEAFIIGWGSPFDPDDHTYKVFGTDKGSNFSGYSNRKIDVLLQEARETQDDQKRLKLYQQYQEELTKDMPYVFIAYIDAIYVGNKNITGLTKDTVLGHHGVGIFWNIADWDMK